MVGGGPDPEHGVRRTRERCTVALVGNHYYGATGSVDLVRLGEPGSPGLRSLQLACDRLSGAAIEWLRSRKPAARRHGVQCWHGGPRNAVWEYVGSSNAGPCLAAQRADLGLVGHTHVPAAWRQTPRGARRAEIRPGVPLEIATGKWLLNPGAVAAPVPSRLGWRDALDLQAADGAFWLLLDLEEHTATWRRAPYDPPPPARAPTRSGSTIPTSPAEASLKPSARQGAVAPGQARSTCPRAPTRLPPRCGLRGRQHGE
jgi:hypothetical protein